MKDCIHSRIVKYCLILHDITLVIAWTMQSHRFQIRSRKVSAAKAWLFINSQWIEGDHGALIYFTSTILDIGRSKIIFDFTLDTINSPRSRTSPLAQYPHTNFSLHTTYHTFCRRAFIHVLLSRLKWERREGRARS